MPNVPNGKDEIRHFIGEKKNFFSWIIYQIGFPLSPVLALFVYLVFNGGVQNAYLATFGKGDLLIFSVLLLVGAVNEFRQTNAQLQVLGEPLQTLWGDVLLFIAFFLLILYGVHLSDMSDMELFKLAKSIREAKVKAWGYISPLGACVAILFSAFATLRCIRALNS